MQLLSSVQQWIIQKKIQLLLVTLLYYVCLAIVNANLQLLIVTCLYGVVVFSITKQWWLTSWLVLLITLPFAKGKTFVFTLIPKEELIERNAIFDVSYILSFYLSDIALLFCYWQIIREPQAQLKKLLSSLQKLRWLGGFLLLFLGIVLIPHWSKTFLPIIGLSSLQLIKTVLLFLLPTFLLAQQHTKKAQFAVYTAIGLFSTVFFQTCLALGQFLNNGPLGWYIEAILPLGNNGQPAALSTMENQDILRVTGSFFDPSLLGTVLFSLLFYFWHQKSLEISVWLKWLIYLAITLTIILTSNRLLILSLFFWWAIQASCNIKKYYFQQKKLFTDLQRYSWLVLPFIAVGVLFVPYLTNRLSSLTSLFAKYGSGTYRLELARYAIRLVHEQPWGVGLNLSPYYLATEFNQEIVSFDPAPPHNILFQLLAETGYAGVAVVTWLIYLIYRPQQIAGKKWPQFFITGSGAAGLAFLYCAQFYPVFINQIETFSWLMLFLGLYWAEKQQQVYVKK